MGVGGNTEPKDSQRKLVYLSKRDQELSLKRDQELTMTTTPWPDYLVLWVSCFLFKQYPVKTDSKDGFEDAVSLDLSALLPCVAMLDKSPFSDFHY